MDWRPLSYIFRDECYGEVADAARFIFYVPRSIWPVEVFLVGKLLRADDR